MNSESNLGEAVAETMVATDAASGDVVQSTVSEEGQAAAESAPTMALVDSPKPKGKGKNKVKVTKPALSADGADQLAKTVFEVENTSLDEITAKVQSLLAEEGYNAFVVGGLLSKARDADFKGNYPDFGVYVREAFGLEKRKAYYLIAIYRGLVAAGVSWDAVQSIGWAKLRLLLNPTNPVLTAENAKSWVRKANKMTFAALAQAIADANASGVAATPGAVAALITFSAKIAPDAKPVIEAAIEKAQKASGTEAKGQALEYIASNYIAGAPVPKIEAPAEGAVAFNAGSEEQFVAIAQAIGWERALNIVADLFPFLTINVEMIEPTDSKAA